MADLPHFESLPEGGMLHSFKLDCQFCWDSLKFVSVEHGWSGLLKKMLLVDKGIKELLGVGVIMLALNVLYFWLVFPRVGLAWTLVLCTGLVCGALWTCVHAVRVRYDAAVLNYETESTAAAKQLHDITIQLQTENQELVTSKQSLEQERERLRAELTERWSEIVALKERPKIVGAFQDIATNYYFAPMPPGKDFIFPTPLGTEIIVSLFLTNENQTSTTVHNFTLKWELLGKAWIARHAEEITKHKDRDIWTTSAQADRNKKMVNLVSYLGDPAKKITREERTEGYLVFRIPGLGVDVGSTPEDMPDKWSVDVTLYVQDKWGTLHPIENQWAQNVRPSLRLSDKARLG